jgi:hypothetical protein
VPDALRVVLKVAGLETNLKCGAAMMWEPEWSDGHGT